MSDTGPVTTSPPFLVTGSGRCGTHVVAELLNRLGVPTGHEEVFAYDESAAGRWGRFRGDCSWPGAAYPHRLPDGAPVLHLVRDPLAVARSRAGYNNLAVAAGDREVVSFVARHQPGILTDASDDLGRALLFVARWNRAVERIATTFPRLPHRRVRIEDVTADPERLAATVEFLTGSAPAIDACRQALSSVDDRTGSRNQRATFGWDEVRAHPNGTEVVELARDYGYRVR